MNNIDVGFLINHKGGLKIMTENQELQKLMRLAFTQQFSNIKAMFIIDFGFEGEFRMDEFRSGDRFGIRISADNGRTGATLMKNPKWLNQFIEDMKI